MSYFVFAGGGTGGHLYPALAVVEQLRKPAAPGAGGDEVAFFCTQRPIDAEILGKAGVPAMPLSVRAFPSRPWHVPGFYLRWRESVKQCVRHFHERQPAAVIGAGGYASGPPVHAALKLGVPTFILNPDAVPGRANRHMGSRRGVTGILAQWDVTRKFFPPEAPVVVSGCPARESFVSAIGGEAAGIVQNSEDRARWARAFELDPARRTLLITGASQGARTINDALLELAPLIGSAGWQVLHLAGVADVDRVRAGYLAAKTSATVLPFTHQMPEAMLLSDLIVSRAGASSLAEITAVGRASILFPYPFHRDQHQKHNGQVLVDAGAAVMLDDTKDAGSNARNLRPVLESLLTDEVRRQSMASAARGLGRPESATVIASVLRAVAASGPGAMRDAPPGSGRASRSVVTYAA